MSRVVCQQFAPRIADLPANRERSVRAVAEAIDAGADVVVLPELVTSGYVFESTGEAASVAITPRHAVFTDWAAEAARGPYPSAAVTEVVSELGVTIDSTMLDLAGGTRKLSRVRAPLPLT